MLMKPLVEMAEKLGVRVEYDTRIQGAWRGPGGR